MKTKKKKKKTKNKIKTVTLKTVVTPRKKREIKGPRAGVLFAYIKPSTKTRLKRVAAQQKISMSQLAEKLLCNARA